MVILGSSKARGLIPLRSVIIGKTGSRTGSRTELKGGPEVGPEEESQLREEESRLREEVYLPCTALYYPALLYPSYTPWVHRTPAARRLVYTAARVDVLEQEGHSGLRDLQEPG